VELRAETRHWLRQVCGGEYETHAGHGQGTRGVDRADACVRDGQSDELDVELVRNVDVGDILLLSGDARLAPDTADRAADHWSTGGCGMSDATVSCTATRG
jgi:hypothetical protein